MIKLVYTTVILFLINSNVFAQTAHATISATITTPVGMEISNDINLNNFSQVNKITSGSDAIISNQGKIISLINIIGESFSHNVTVENYYALSDRNMENEKTLSVRKRESYVGITVNFD